MYRVNEIFYSLQGEGKNTGRAAIFVRFAGCNLRCPFCDTSFDDYREMTAEGILHTIQEYPSHFMILTGGEPTLQVDESFVDYFHAAGYEVAMESNGTLAPPRNLDWLTLSPKGHLVVDRCNELKLVFEGDDDEQLRRIEAYREQVSADYHCLQPCDTGDETYNRQLTTQCVDYILHHPQWHLSLQTHKLAHFK